MCLDAATIATWWTADPLALGVIGTSSALYARGVRSLWSKNGVGHGIRRREAASFAAGELLLFLALASPLDALSDILFSAHMTQHEVLMVLAPPLFVLGRPITAAMWAIPRAWRSPLASLSSRSLVRTIWRFTSAPLAALLLHALVVWLWHAPALFEATLRDEAVHAVQHATFFGSAVLFWWSVLRGRYGRAGYGLACVYVFATAMHTSVLGVLLTLAGDLWYPSHAERTASIEVDALSDQRLAGLVMWVPMGTVLAMVALALFAAWLGESERRARALARRVVPQ